MDHQLPVNEKKSPVRRGDEVTLEITGAAFEGKSVARLDGFVVFVEGAVPGDVVRARIRKVRKNLAEARTITVERPSPLRVEPRCKHFGVCGGCKWQHVDYEAQLRFKHQHVAEAFQRIGGVDDPPVRPIIGAENIYFYRNKMEYSFSEHQWLEYPPAGDETGNSPDTPPTSRPPTTFHPSPVFLGLHVPQRYDKVLDIDECHLQSDVSNRILGFIRDYALKHSLPVYSSRTNSGYLRFLVIRQSRRTGGLMVNCVTFEDWPEVMRALTAELTAAIPEVTTVVNTINDRKAQIAYGDRETVYFGEGVIEERLGRHRFRISAQSFFQTNTEQAERLYAVVRDLAGLSGKETVYDLYSGTGTIALELSDVAWEVVGIESVASSVADAERNAKANNVRNCRFVLGDLKDRLTKDTTWMQELPAPDVLIIDPPRSGMHPGVVEAIRSMRVPRIVYVSCNPATQARDVRMLSPDPYRLLSLQPVDMFPHTYHIENVALLELV